LVLTVTVGTTTTFAWFIAKCSLAQDELTGLNKGIPREMPMAQQKPEQNLPSSQEV
jgi:hypothetical protein